MSVFRTLAGMPRAFRALLVVCAVSALLGCGGDGDDNGGGSPPAQDTAGAQETATATPEPTLDPEHERAIAERAQLRLDDFPADLG